MLLVNCGRMQHPAVNSSNNSSQTFSNFSRVVNRVRSEFPRLNQTLAALLSAVVLILAFPDFEFWPLAWIALIPILVVLIREPKPWRNFFVGWVFGTVFFYGSCYWLTYSVIHTGGISPVIAYVLLVPGAVLLGVFPALFTLFLAQTVRHWGRFAVFSAPVFWAALELARLEITGQLWNAIGYSQAYHPMLIRSARFGGVYAVGFLIVWTNVALANLLLARTTKALMVSLANLIGIVLVGFIFAFSSSVDWSTEPGQKPDLAVVAVQPNVPVEPIADPKGGEALTAAHLAMSDSALQSWELNGRVDNSATDPVTDWARKDSVEGRRDIPRLVIWPESPMNFAYGSDSSLRAKLAPFAQSNNT